MYDHRPDRYENPPKYLVQVWSDGAWEDDECFVEMNDLIEYVSDLEDQGIRTRVERL